MTYSYRNWNWTDYVYVFYLSIYSSKRHLHHHHEHQNHHQTHHRLYNWTKLFAAAYKVYTILWTTLRKCLIQFHVVVCRGWCGCSECSLWKHPRSHCKRGYGGCQSNVRMGWNMVTQELPFTEINSTINDPWVLKSSFLSSSNEREWGCSVISVTIHVPFHPLPFRVVPLCVIIRFTLTYSELKT